MFGMGEEEHERLHAGSAELAPPPDAPAPAPAYGPEPPGSVPASLLGHLPPSSLAAGAGGGSQVVEYVRVALEGDAPESLRVEYTLSSELTRKVYEILQRSRVQLGQALVLDPASGELLAFASINPTRLPATRTYPAASLVKVVTAAAALERSPAAASRTCRYVGSPYRLTPSRVNPPRRGREVSLEKALATSNNQCFAQLAVHDVGSEAMLESLERFGLLAEPAPTLPPGVAEDPHGSSYKLGQLGSGLAGLRITPLHAAVLAATLAEGKLVEPRWIARVTDAEGRELLLPEPTPARKVISRELARQLRSMMTATTERGTARKGFRTAAGRTLLRHLDVAAKTGTLSGKDPDGRYEWFIGVAPANDAKLAIAVLVVQGRRWYSTPSRIASEILYAAFCDKGLCSPELVDRWRAVARAPVRSPGSSGAPPAPDPRM
jgi:cell division protein FtsI/penicillin-binding protein 2